MNVRRRWRLLLRLNAIRRVFMRHGLDELVWRLHLLRPIAWLRALLPRRRPRLPLGARLRLALEELGPIYVKFGQALSVRPDLLAPEVAFELAKLQDQVPPFAGEAAVAALERAYGRPVDDVFAFFDREPLAAASIAQVHAARLRDGTDVVVKVLRPNVRALIERDVEVLYAAAALAERYWPEARRLHPSEVVAEFEKTLAAEIDPATVWCNIRTVDEGVAERGYPSNGAGCELEQKQCVTAGAFVIRNEVEDVVQDGKTPVPYLKLVQHQLFAAALYRDPPEVAEGATRLGLYVVQVPPVHGFRGAEASAGGDTHLASSFPVRLPDVPLPGATGTEVNPRSVPRPVDRKIVRRMYRQLTHRTPVGSDRENI
jgi:hypothetical protein